MKISSNEARQHLADIEKRFEEGRIRKEHEWLIKKSPWSWNFNDYDWSTPEGYDDSPDQGVHQFDGGGTFF
jgi:hypothetical protein